MYIRLIIRLVKIEGFCYFPPISEVFNSIQVTDMKF